MTIAQLLAESAAYLKDLGLESPRLEAEILLAHALGIKRIQLYSQHERILTEAELARCREFISCRAKHEPTAYITGVQPFMSLDFFVDRSVLIPRPETEELVELVIAHVSHDSSPITHYSIADIGTGSGAIAVSLAKFLPNVKVVGTDNSTRALEVARKNATFHQVADRCEFRLGNLLEPLTEKVDIIVSNPPYIPTAEIETLQPEVKDWEPRQALDGGKDGLDYYKKIIPAAARHLASSGRLYLEIVPELADNLAALLKVADCFENINLLKDLKLNHRFALASYKER